MTIEYFEILKMNKIRMTCDNEDYYIKFISKERTQNLYFSVILKENSQKI